MFACTKSKCQVEKAENNRYASLGIPCTQLCTCHLCDNKYQSMLTNADVDDDDKDPDAADDDTAVRQKYV